MFDEAIQGGLAAIQTQHPGFYYQSAATQALSWRTTAQNMRSVEQYPQPDPLAFKDSLEYFGQRSWRVGISDSWEQSDISRNAEGFAALQYLEQRRDTSKIIIHLLSNAMGYFKRYRCPRMKRYNMVQLAEEYYLLGDYPRALHLLTSSLWELQRWFLPLESTLKLAIKCAFCSGNIKDYVGFGLGLLGPKFNLQQKERERIQTNLMRVFGGEIPEAEPEISKSVVAEAQAKWRQVIAERCFFMIPMQNIHSCLEAKCTFSSSEIHADNNICVKIYLRLLSPFPIQFSKLAVAFNNEFYNESCVVTDSTDPRFPNSADPRFSDPSGASSGTNLYLMSNQTKSLEFSFGARREDVGTNLEITGLNLDVGALQGLVYGTLHWEFSSGAPSCDVPLEYFVCHRLADPISAIPIISSTK